MTMTDNTTLPADWAIERALAECETVNFDLAEVKRDPRLYRLTISLARYIEKHEQPPVDPWTLQARELAAGVSDEAGCTNAAERYRKGTYDDDPEVQALAAALKAAYEKGKCDDR